MAKIKKVNCSQSKFIVLRKTDNFKTLKLMSLGGFLLVILLFIYLVLSFISEEKKVVPFERDWYDYSIDFTNIGSDCFFRVHSIWTELNLQKGETRNIISFNTDCSNEVYLMLRIENTTKFWQPNEEPWLVLNSTNESTGTARYAIYPDKFTSNTVEIRTENRFGFNSYFDIRVPEKVGLEEIRLHRVDFIYDGWKFLCEKDCIAIKESKESKEATLFAREGFRSVKVIETKGGRLLLRFNPESVKWVLIQKVIDGIAFGLIAAIFFAAFINPILRKFS